MNNITVLIIDDEVNLTRSLTFALKQEAYQCLVANDVETGLELAETEKPDAVLLDIRLGDASGLDVLPNVKAILPDAPVIMMSAYGDTKDVVQAIKLGAVDYLTKPFDMDELFLLLQENVARKKLQHEVEYLRQKTAFSDGLVGESVAVKRLSENIERVASSTVKTILLLGETGVGKTLVAREIHNKTMGKQAPFVEINCASLPAELIEAELFGAEKGAYTGAVSKRIGLVEVADKGTLFLDEIGELPLHLQAKLLTFLESWTYRSIGGVREKVAEVLVVMATNRNLSVLVDEQRFRNDLYFRINTMPIHIPSLRERDNDLQLLIQHFMALYSRREGSQPIVLSEHVKTVLQHYRWPGNIRELKNLIERLTILYSGKRITVEHLPVEIRDGNMGNEINQSVRETDNIPSSSSTSAPSSHANAYPHIDEPLESPTTITDSLMNSERELILKALNECHWRKGITAQKLGISRHALKRRIQKLGLE